MTNTRYIGPVDHIAQIDRLQARTGFKVVMITIPDENGNIAISGPHHYDKPYTLSSDSVCHVSKTDTHDFEVCACGFYSYNHALGALHHWHSECGGFSNQALVRVALSQKVVVCEKGYRSSHQRVTSIVMPPCWNCSTSAGTMMVPHSAGYFVAGCETCLDDVPTLREVSYTFDEFSEKFSPSGYSRMKITSYDGNPVSVMNGNDWKMNVLKTLEPDFHLKQVEPLVEKMVKEGDLSHLKILLSLVQSSIDGLMDKEISLMLNGD